jgi:hypothetical protein
MVKHKVSWSIKDSRNVLIPKELTFDTSEAACSHFRDIKGVSFTVPEISTVEREDHNVKRNK